MFHLFLIDPTNSNQGMHAQIIKAVLQQALLFVLRDIFEKYTLTGVLILRGLHSSS